MQTLRAPEQENSQVAIHAVSKPDIHIISCVRRPANGMQRSCQPASLHALSAFHYHTQVILIPKESSVLSLAKPSPIGSFALSWSSSCQHLCGCIFMLLTLSPTPAVIA
jgi:hypothetical protein